VRYRCAAPRCPLRSPLPLPAHAPPGNTLRVRPMAFLLHAHPAGGASARPAPRPSPRALASRIDDDDRSTSWPLRLTCAGPAKKKHNQSSERQHGGSSNI
jgi:hypothetical protein